MEFVDYANRIGIPWAAVLCMLVIGWKGGKAVLTYLAIKFFDEELDKYSKPKGYIPKLVEGQIDLMTEMKVSLHSIRNEVLEIKGKINCPKSPHPPSNTTG